MRICPKCGFEIDNDSALYCKKCGSKLPAIKAQQSFNHDYFGMSQEDLDLHWCYPNLVNHIYRICTKYNIKRKRIQDILSMRRAESIETLIQKFNDVFELLAYDFYNGRDFPPNWYQHEYWGNLFTNHVEDLYQCLNENIVRWFEKQEKPTIEQCTSCIVNLRECSNKKGMQNSILSVAGENVASDIDHLIRLRERYHYMRLGFYQKTRMNSQFDSDSFRKKYIDLSNTMAASGHVFDVIEKAFAKEYAIDYAALHDSYNQQEEKEEKAQYIEHPNTMAACGHVLEEKEEEQEIEQEKKGSKTKTLVWTIILIVANVVNFFVLLTSQYMNLRDLLLFYSMSVGPGLIFLFIHYALKHKKEDVTLSENETKWMDTSLIGALTFFVLPIIMPILGEIKDSIGGIGLIIVLGLLGGIPSLLLRGKL
ncbi:MAG: zinc ribbon domain-containing protein [Bacteroidaceae bacterium]|nr:zinc ribbon domain-containing protein [Bacteroidaceae bacterium]